MGGLPTASPFSSEFLGSGFLTNSSGKHQLQSIGRVRSEFPETWIWSNSVVGYVIPIEDITSPYRCDFITSMIYRL